MTHLHQRVPSSGRVAAELRDDSLASNCDGTNHHQKVSQEDEVASKSVFSKLFGRKRTKKVNKTKKTTSSPVQAPRAPIAPKSISPQEYLDQELLKRGHSTKTYATLRTAYYNEPTKLQRASYDVHVLKIIIRDKDEDALRDLLSCGISPNACNKYGESLLHKVCKSGLAKLLHVFLECGVDVQVSDGAGRTPLHNACWASRPSFETFETVLKQDPSMIFLKDYTGALPLSYVRKGQEEMWIKFLKSIIDVYWKPLNDGQEHQLSPLMFLPAKSRPIPDPELALPIKLAKLVASGRMEPDEAMIANDSYGDRDWDDDSSVGSLCSVASAAMSGYDDAPWVQSESSLGGSEYDSEAEGDDILEFDGLDQLAGLEEMMGISMKQKQRQAAGIPTSVRTTI